MNPLTPSVDDLGYRSERYGDHGRAGQAIASIMTRPKARPSR